MPDSNRTPIAFATVGKPHGIRGAVTVVVSAHHVGVLTPGFELVCEQRGARVGRTVANVGGTPERPIVSFEGVATRNEAEALRGATLFAPRAALAPLDEDEFYFVDLEGCEAFADGERIGVVRRVRSMPTQELLEIDGPDGDVFVPFTRVNVPHVDVAARRVEIAPAALEIDG